MADGLQAPPSARLMWGLDDEGGSVADWCSCGRSADRRCGCGNFMCWSHVCRPWWDQRRDIGAWLSFWFPQGGELARVARAIVFSWRGFPKLLCEACYHNAIPEVAQQYAQAVAGLRPDRAGAVLLYLDTWVTKFEKPSTPTLGMRTMSLLGESPVWAHRSPTSTGAHLLATTNALPESTSLYVLEYRTGLFGGPKPPKLCHAGDLRAWSVAFCYSSGPVSEGYGTIPQVALIGEGGGWTTVDARKQRPQDPDYPVLSSGQTVLSVTAALSAPPDEDASGFPELAYALAVRVLAK
jgi:hypothetical protein